MKTKQTAGFLLILLLTLQIFLCLLTPLSVHAQQSPDVYVGIDLAYGDTPVAKALIDQVSPYTNLIVIGTSAITGNLTKLNETCQYAFDKGLSFINLWPSPMRANRTGWFDYAQQNWGNRILGFYTYDEPAGRQLDRNISRIATNPTSYLDAANQFEANMSSQLNHLRSYLTTTNYQLFTADYALYWFDYKSGYDTLFAEFGWNYSRQYNIALCRGAATLANKDWGAIILYTYTNPPYLESGPELLQELILAYDNGAKYITIFDSNIDYTAGILQQEHLQALQQFWQYIRDNPRHSSPISSRVAYVLPNSFGYGFRGPADLIWGVWPSDANTPNTLTYNVSISISGLLQKYGSNLDIIYDDGLQPGNNYGYSKLIYWNDTALLTEMLPTPTPTQSPVPTQAQELNPDFVQTPSSSYDYTPMAIIGVAMSLVGVPLFMSRRKRECSVTFAQTGIGREFTGTVLVVDGQSYDRYGTSFWWQQGSRHSVEFKSPILAHGKRYVLEGTSGLEHCYDNIMTARNTTTITGNYKPLFRTGNSQIQMHPTFRGYPRRYS